MNLKGLKTLEDELLLKPTRKPFNQCVNIYLGKIARQKVEVMNR